MTQEADVENSAPDLPPVDEFYSGLEALDSTLVELPQDVPEPTEITTTESPTDVRETETPVGETWFTVSETVREHFSGLSAANHEYDPQSNEPLYLRAAYPDPSEPATTIRVTYKPSGTLFVEAKYYIGLASWPYYLGTNEGLSIPVLYAAAIAAGLNYSSVAVATGQTQLSYHQGLAVNSAVGDVHERLEDLRDDTEESTSENTLDKFLALVKDRPEWTI
ncbi:hypothetical protein [Natrinema salsiterrestre]|uniref:Uncharacterized protein n=1 Tax=Natrinema salsiterrestre TaxID=2950540 RepID=A0A9Q4L029_9EURY|nr:hypothetical protein [Natrinema salsiterrestre]MDF9745029.1 hypothetical protein [Natrinema salsiterrestre]